MNLRQFMLRLAQLRHVSSARSGRRNVSRHGRPSSCVGPQTQSLEHRALLTGQFDNAVVWDIDNVSSIAGSLSAAGDSEFFEIDITAPQSDRFEVDGTGRRITLYNDFGQIVDFTDDGGMSTGDWVSTPRPLGRHFLEIKALDVTGVGGFTLRHRWTIAFPQDRDVPLFFFDFTGQAPHQGNTWQNVFGRPDAVPLLSGLFDAQFDGYDIDTTLTLPGAGTEYVGIGVGDLGTSGGFGGGSVGVRRPVGHAVAQSNSESNWDEPVDLASLSGLMRHELGHGLGLRHARHVLSHMSYAEEVHATPVGSYYIQAGGTPEVSWTKIQNEREHLDWRTQAGRHIVEAEPNNSSLTAESVDAHLAAMSGDADPRNDKVIVVGKLDTAIDADFFRLTVTAGETFWFDIESSEYQHPLNSILTIYDSGGMLVAQNDQAMDRNSGLTSADPFLTHTFVSAGEYFVAVESRFGTTGNYRLKIIPERAFDHDGPRVIAASTYAGESIDSTRQLIFWMDSQLDPASLTSSNVIVQGAVGGIRSGSVYLDPLKAALVWTADAALPPDTYTVRLTDGITDLYGNALDGETTSPFEFPDVSGNGSAGGTFQMTFTVQSADGVPAEIVDSEYRRHPTNRGQFLLEFDDELSLTDLVSTDFTLTGSGPDQQFSTVDDISLPVDLYYQDDSPWEDRAPPSPTLMLFTRGIPDAFEPVIDPLDVGGFPIGMTTADFNGDGIADIATANLSSDTVSVSFGLAAGGFGSASSYSAGDKSSSVAAGDLNGDGRPDLVVSNNGNNTISILLNAGNGTFLAQTTMAAGSLPQDVMLTDLNGDNRLDAVVSNSSGTSGGTVSVFLGNGNGGFSAQTQFATDFGSVQAVASDVTGDNKPDLIVANLNTSRVNVLAGDGNGAFTALSTTFVGSRPTGLIVHDFNGDAKPDMAVTIRDSNVIEVRPGNGDGTFGAAIQYAVGQRPVAVAGYDLNGDGNMDLISANEDDSSFSVLIGSAAGTFASKVDYPLGGGPLGIAAIDANRDGLMDLAASLAALNTVDFLAGGGDGTFGNSARPYRIDGTIKDAAGHSITISEIVSVTPDVLPHGPSVTWSSVRPHEAVTDQRNQVQIAFSGQLNAATLTTANVTLRHSSNAVFFDGDDVFLNDGDGQIAWNSGSLTATFETATALPDGYYLLELNGESSGISDVRGQLLDGEFLDSSIIGNEHPSLWPFTPSGNGLPGGDYRLPFVVATPALNVDVSADTIAENGGITEVTIVRANASDLSVAQSITLAHNGGSDFILPSVVSIPAGVRSRIVSGIAQDDSRINGVRQITVTATAVGFVSGAAQVELTDDDSAGLIITESGGQTVVSEDGTTDTFTVQLTAQPTSSVVVTVRSNDVSEVVISPALLTFSSTNWNIPQTVTVTGVDDSVVDGPATTLVTLAIDDANSDDAFDALADRFVSVVTEDNEQAFLDVDGNGSPDAATDGILIIRYLFGFRGNVLISGAIGANAGNTTAAGIETALAASVALLDADGNGVRDAATDGILIIRYLFGFRDTPLVAGAIGTGATRATGAEVAAFLDGFLPPPPTPPAAPSTSSSAAFDADIAKPAVSDTRLKTASTPGPPVSRPDPFVTADDADRQSIPIPQPEETGLDEQFEKFDDWLGLLNL